MKLNSHKEYEIYLNRISMQWSNDEHLLFLKGLEIYGKGDWKGISKSLVLTRTPVQVASHAQKYFLRKEKLKMCNTKLRKSIFDLEKKKNQNSNIIKPSLKFYDKTFIRSII